MCAPFFAFDLVSLSISSKPNYNVKTMMCSVIHHILLVVGVHIEKFIHKSS